MSQSLSKIFPLRLSEEEKEIFQASADKEGMKLSAWLRRAATRTAELESALVYSKKQFVEALKDPPVEALDWSEGDSGKELIERTQAVKDRIYPQSKKSCPHRLNPGAWCKTCKRVK